MEANQLLPPDGRQRTVIHRHVARHQCGLSRTPATNSEVHPSFVVSVLSKYIPIRAQIKHQHHRHIMSIVGEEMTN
jgi:hypothetical protein